VKIYRVIQIKFNLSRGSPWAIASLPHPLKSGPVGEWARCFGTDTDKARKHGLDEFVQANPSKLDHHQLFSALQRLTLVYRLNDNFACLVRPTHSSIHVSSGAARGGQGARFPPPEIEFTRKFLAAPLS